MFSSRHQPLNFAQFYTSQGSFVTGSDVLSDHGSGSWHSPSGLSYASSCAARTSPYDDWGSPQLSGHPQQSGSPTCSHASSPGIQPLPYGYHHTAHHQGYRLTPPTSADYSSGGPGSCASSLVHGTHFVYPDIPPPPPQAPPQPQQACSPDSGVALGSDGGVVSGSESPSGCLGPHLSSSHGVHPALHQAGIMAGCINNSRPQPARSPYEWIKKPSYQLQIQPGKTRTKDKYRVVYTDHQRLELEKEFHYSRYITIRRKSELAQLLCLSERQVKIWFQNRRAKERKQIKKKEELARREFAGTDLSALKLESDGHVLCLGPSVLSPTTCAA